MWRVGITCLPRPQCSFAACKKECRKRQFGRQVGWRHRATVAVFKSDCEVTRSSSCLAAGYNLDGVVKLVGGAVQAVAVFKSDCLVLGLWMRAQTRSSSCLAALDASSATVAVFKSDCEVLGLLCGLKLGVERTPLLLGPKCRKFVVGGVEEASLVSTSAPLFVTYSRVNQWQICCAFVETVHLWRPKRCVVDLLMLGHKSWCFRLFVDGLSTFRCH